MSVQLATESQKNSAFTHWLFVNLVYFFISYLVTLPGVALGHSPRMRNAYPLFHFTFGLFVYLVGFFKIFDAGIESTPPAFLGGISHSF